MRNLKLLLGAVIFAGLTAGSLYAGVQPENGSKGVPVDTDLEITFNEPVRAGEGEVSVVNASTGEVFYRVDINSVNVNFSEERMFVNIPGEFEKADYYVTISQTAVRDIAGNYYKGIRSSGRWTFSTLSGDPGLERFKARSDRGIVKLDWKSHNEETVRGYKIYRSEHNAAGSGQFELIDSYKLNDDLKVMTKKELDDYSKTDNDPDLLPGRSYSYKLIAVGQEGEEILSKMTEVQITKSGLIEISELMPNPVKDVMNFDLTLNKEQNVTIEIIDRIGRQIMVPVSNKNFGNGLHNISFSIEEDEISNGMYILKVTTNSDVVTKKFMVSR